jgi:hypothetical protein
MSAAIELYKVGRAVGNIWSLLILAKNRGLDNAEAVRELEEQLQGLDDNILEGYITDPDLAMSALRGLSDQILDLFPR